MRLWTHFRRGVRAGSDADANIPLIGLASGGGGCYTCGEHWLRWASVGCGTRLPHIRGESAGCAGGVELGAQAELSAIPASFGNNSTGGGAYAYPSRAGVSFPHSQVQTHRRTRVTRRATSNTSGSPSTYTATLIIYPIPDHTWYLPEYRLHPSNAYHNHTVPGPMPLRPPGTVGSYDLEWDNAGGTDEGRCVSCRFVNKIAHQLSPFFFFRFF
ncbi:hypothetical protein B0H19DRAFT_544360 [Mycena capillaripes]|nr:hypothetical protein B0H19DRAFT_544360 [Mycena capillaripes]